MAITGEKYRLNTLAKDLEMKSKDITEILANIDFIPKSHMTALEDAQISYVLEVVTQNNQVNIEEFFNSYKSKVEEAPIAKDAPKPDGGKKSTPSSPKSAETSKQAENKPQQPSKPQSDNAPKQEQKKKDRTQVRVVDTRGSVEADLSKYDEKNDRYTSDIDTDESGKTKIKKKNQKQQNTGGKPGFEKGKNPFGKEKKKPYIPPKPAKLVVTVPDEITVGELASRMKTAANEVIKKLMMTMGIMAGINQTIDYETAFFLAAEFGYEVEKEVVISLEERLFDDSADAPESLVERPPVVVVMGHVDHGKTSLLDAIRHTSVTAGEAGGITQHIGAYTVNIDGRDITFLDTPGHEAFTAMRARGAMLTDIAILVVAADDGIMPQTVEAISHAKAAGVSIIVAINKMDKPGATSENIKQELTRYELVPEEWGGDTICVEVSALKKTGIKELLEMVLLTADILELKANPNRAAKGAVIEARLDKGRGAVSTVLVQSGTLKTGDIVIAGTAVGHVRVMTDDKGRRVQSAGPSVPVEITGLSEVPQAGDEFNAVKDEKLARELAENRKFKEKEEANKAQSSVSLDDLFSRIGSGLKELNLIVKADVQGSAEAVKASLMKLSNEEVKVNVIHAGVGAVKETDVMLASTSNAIIICFNIRPDKLILSMAAEKKVDIRSYRIIYECIEQIEQAMKGMLAPITKETIIGRVEVRELIKISRIGTIAGSYVTDGKVQRGALVRILRDSVVVFEDKIASLRRMKDDVREVAQGYECGIFLEKFTDIKQGDVLEVYIIEQIART